MTEFVARALFPISLVIAAALWIKGYSDVGDGFSAGAVAALGAVIQYVSLDHQRAAQAVGAAWAVRLLGAGLMLVVLVVIVIPPVLGHPPVSHWPAPGAEVVKLGSLELHTALLFDLGVGLIVYGGIVATFDQLFPVWSGEEGSGEEGSGAER